VITQADVWWADLGEPSCSDPGYRRPVVVVQCDAFNRSRIATVVCVPLTSSLRWSRAPGNVFVAAAATGLPKDSVAIVSQLIALDRGTLVERVARLPDREFELILGGIDVVLGR
jgi:mRNA interferase MazF